MRHFVLVSAANANDLKLNRTFMYCAERRQNYLLSKHRKKDDLTVTWFDVTSGLCQQTTMDSKGRRSKPKPLKRYKAVTRSSYQPRGTGWQFRDGQPDVMSIVDIYKFVEGQEANTVFELSFFAHAWEEGPVLVDSYEDGEYRDATRTVVKISDGARDPDDKDARLNDFEPLNRDLPKFRAAFNSAGAVRNWGCLHTDRDVDLFKAFFANDAYRSKGMKDKQTLVLRIHKKLEGELIGRLPVKNGVLTLTFGELRRHFHSALASCYTAKAAKGANTTAYGSAAGNGSVPGDTGAAPMFIVTRKGHNKQIIEFYQEYLNVTFDDAFYAEYRPEERPFEELS